MFAYCNNNPIAFVDPSGDYPLWYYLFEDHRPGFIHMLVEAHILGSMKSIRNLDHEYTVATGRADLVDLDTGEVWEIKHGGSGQYVERTIAAVNQAKKYIGYGPITQLGAMGAFSGSFNIDCMGKTYQVSYCTPLKGAVIYTVQALDNAQKEVQYAYVPNRAKNLQPSFNTNSVMASGGIALGMMALAFSVCTMEYACR